MNAWGTILQKKAEVGLGWWIIGFSISVPKATASLSWCRQTKDVGTKRANTPLWEMCHAPLSAEIHEWQTQRGHAGQGIPQGGTHGRNLGNTAGSGTVWGCLGFTLCVWECSELPLSALASVSVINCGYDFKNLVMILKISSLKSTHCWEILIKKIGKPSRGEPTASDYSF